MTDRRIVKHTETQQHLSTASNFDPNSKRVPDYSEVNAATQVDEEAKPHFKEPTKLQNLWSIFKNNVAEYTSELGNIFSNIAAKFSGNADHSTFIP